LISFVNVLKAASKKLLNHVIILTSKTAEQNGWSTENIYI